MSHSRPVKSVLEILFELSYYDKIKVTVDAVLYFPFVIHRKSGLRGFELL